MRNCNKDNYLIYCFLLTPIYFLISFSKGIHNMFYAGLMAIFWTFVLYFEDTTESSIGRLYDHDKSLFPLRSMSIFINTWWYFMDQKFKWMIKLSVFHSIMMSRFIARKIWCCIINELVMMVMVFLTPIQPYLMNYIYWVIMSTEFTDWMFKNWLGIMLNGLTFNKLQTRSKSTQTMNYRMLLLDYNRRSCPLPKKMMVLSCVQLNEVFVGWLSKIGYQFGVIFMIFNNIGVKGMEMFKVMIGCSSKTYALRGRNLRQWLTMWFCWIQFTSCPVTAGPTTDHNLVDFNLNDVQECCAGGCTMELPHRSTNIDYSNMPSCCLTASPSIAVLSSSSEDNKDKFTNANSDFSLGTYEFGMDNCATHHICGDRNLFTILNDLPNTVHVNGISGSSMAKGIGTIRFHIMDTKGHDHLVVLDNVIYLPGAAKNLISVSQWAKDKADNAGIMSRGTFSRFLWENDEHEAIIDHPPDCPIPLMSVTTPGENQFSAFLASQSASLIDNEALSYINPDLDRATAVDQQSTNVPSVSNLDNLFKPGTTVRSFLNGVSRVSIITHAFRSATTNIPKYKIRHLNQSDEIEVDDDSLVEIVPEPANIPTSIKDVDTKLLEQTLPEEHVQILWSGDLYNTVPDADRLTLH